MGGTRNRADRRRDALSLLRTVRGLLRTVRAGLLSPALARRNAKAVPDIVRNGQPFRTLFPTGQEVERFPRIGWDRPKASDHCPVTVRLDIG